MNNDLISREAVIERIKYEADVCNSGITRGVLKFLQAIVENMPSAVDAVEVVRCSKCEYGEEDDPDFPNQYFCHYTGHNWNMGDHFCGYGEPRMDGE